MFHFKRVVVLKICVLLLCSSNTVVFASESEEDLIMGIFPRRNAVDTIKLFTPMAKHLSTELGRNVRLKTAKNFPVFWENVKNQKYDIVHYNQYHYVKSAEKYGYQVFAKNEEFGKSSLASAFVIRSDSGISTLADLKGKKILFGGGKKAMVAYIANTVMLRKAGLNKGDYIEEFSKNPPNATFATYYKRTNASGVGDVALDIPMIRKTIDVDQLQYLAIGDRLPHIPWAFKKSLSAKSKENIKEILLQLDKTPSGKKILTKARLTGISAASDSEYEIVRQVIREYEAISK